jgi:hypothetical protein
VRTRLLAIACVASLMASSGVAVADTAAAPLPGDVHTAAAATAKAQHMLALITLPAGTAVEEPSTAPLLQTPWEYPSASQENVADVMQWWSVPGADAAFSTYLAALTPSGLTGDSSAGSDREPARTTFSQTGFADSQAASVVIAHIPDGDHVDVRIDSYVVWLTPRTAAETIPAAVTSAVLDYVGAPDPFPPYGGEDTTPKPKHAHVAVTGAQLRRMIRDLNSLPPDGPWYRSCAAGTNERVTVVFTVGGHRKTFWSNGDGCDDVNVEAYNQGQPSLVGAYLLFQDAYATLGVRSTPIPLVPKQGLPPTTPAPKLTVLERNKVQAQRAGDKALEGYGLYAPGDSRLSSAAVSPPRPSYMGPGHFVDRAWFYTIPGKREDLVAWYRHYVPKGYVAAEPVKGPKGVRMLVLVPRDHSKPVSAIVWISMEQRGGHVDFRIDAQTAWLPKKS